MERMADQRSKGVESIMADFTNENNKEFRPLILKLGQKITDRLGRKITPDDPE